MRIEQTLSLMCTALIILEEMKSKIQIIPPLKSQSTPTAKRGSLPCGLWISSTQTTSVFESRKTQPKVHAPTLLPVLVSTISKPGPLANQAYSLLEKTPPMVLNSESSDAKSCVGGKSCSLRRYYCASLCAPCFMCTALTDLCICIFKFKLSI